MALQKRFNDPRKQFVDPYWTIISSVLSHGRGRPKTDAWSAKNWRPRDSLGPWHISEWQRPD